MVDADVDVDVDGGRAAQGARTHALLGGQDGTGALQNPTGGPDGRRLGSNSGVAMLAWVRVCAAVLRGMRAAQ